MRIAARANEQDTEEEYEGDTESATRPFTLRNLLLYNHGVIYEGKIIVLDWFDSEKSGRKITE